MSKPKSELAVPQELARNFIENYKRKKLGLTS